MGIVLAYALGVLWWWAYEATDWITDNRKAAGGFRASAAQWWTENAFSLIRRGLLHVILCALWMNGWLLEPLNATIGKVVAMAQEDQGIAMAPMFPAVTWQVTAPAATLLDIVGRPVARRVQAILFALAGKNGSGAAGVP